MLKKTQKGNLLAVGSRKKKRKRQQQDDEKEDDLTVHANVVENLEKSINKEKQLEAAVAEQTTKSQGFNELEQMKYQAQLAYERYKRKNLQKSQTSRLLIQKKKKIK